MLITLLGRVSSVLTTWSPSSARRSGTEESVKLRASSARWTLPFAQGEGRPFLALPSVPMSGFAGMGDTC